MPSVALGCEVHAFRVSVDTRKYRDTDFWDLEHAAVPAAYADAFVSLDRGLVDTLRRCRTPAAQGCELLGSLDALQAWLAGL
jgi:hypothetical protein